MQTKAETHNIHTLTSQYSRAYLTIHAGLRHFGDLLFSWRVSVVHVSMW